MIVLFNCGLAPAAEAVAEEVGPLAAADGAVAMVAMIATV